MIATCCALVIVVASAITLELVRRKDRARKLEQKEED